MTRIGEKIECDKGKGTVIEIVKGIDGRFVYVVEGKSKRNFIIVEGDD